MCSSASRTSASSAFLPTRRFAGERNTYKTRGRDGPAPGRPLCMTYVCSKPRLSRLWRMNGTTGYFFFFGFVFAALTGFLAVRAAGAGLALAGVFAFAFDGFTSLDV